MPKERKERGTHEEACSQQDLVHKTIKMTDLLHKRNSTCAQHTIQSRKVRDNYCPQKSRTHVEEKKTPGRSRASRSLKSMRNRDSRGPKEDLSDWQGEKEFQIHETTKAHNAPDGDLFVGRPNYRSICTLLRGTLLL